jgi:hypothetical protein
MPAFLTDAELAAVEAATDRLVPGDDAGFPSASAAGAGSYIDTLLGAFTFDPPRIWGGGPFSGRWGGDAAFEEWLPLGAVEELAWRTRIEGSQGIAEREFNGAVVGLQQMYRDGIAALGEDFTDVDGDEQDQRLDALPQFKRVLYDHACEGMYGDPVYGGNRDQVGWKMIGWLGDIQPRGYTDVEVTQREKTPVVLGVDGGAIGPLATPSSEEGGDG